MSSHSQTGYNTKGTRAHTHRELIREWLWEPKGMMMICLPPQGTPPPHSSRYGPQHTQHTASTAATPHYPQDRRQTPADAPTPLKRSMLTPFGGPRPRFSAKARERAPLNISRCLGGESKPRPYGRFTRRPAAPRVPLGLFTCTPMPGPFFLRTYVTKPAPDIGVNPMGVSLPFNLGLTLTPSR